MPRMNHRPVSLTEFFHEHRDSRRALVLATVVQTIGSTYRKAGAQMLIAADGSAAGLLSGGCLEADLVERARRVIDTGEALIAEYDTRSSDDILQVEQGSLYPALHRLIKRGLIAFDDGTSENNRRAKFYRLTAKGRKQQEIETGRWETLARAIARVLRPAGQE